MGNTHVQAMSLNNDHTKSIIHDQTMRIRVGRRGTITLPKEVREELGIHEGTTLKLIVEKGRLILEPDDMWARLKRRKMVSPEEAERILDEAE